MNMRTFIALVIITASCLFMAAHRAAAQASIRLHYTNNGCGATWDAAGDITIDEPNPRRDESITRRYVLWIMCSGAIQSSWNGGPVVEWEGEGLPFGPLQWRFAQPITTSRYENGDPRTYVIPIVSTVAEREIASIHYLGQGRAYMMVCGEHQPAPEESIISTDSKTGPK